MIVVPAGCGVRVTSKKWMWIDKLKKFGNVSQKTTKYICEFRRKGPTAPEISTRASSIATRLDEVGRLLLSDVNTRGNDLGGSPDEKGKSELI